MKYKTEDWEKPKTIKEMIKYLQTLPENTKIFSDLRLVTVLNDENEDKNYELQIKKRDIEF